MAPDEPSHRLAYATHVERDFARARLVAAIVTGPAGVLLMLTTHRHAVLGLLGLLCVLASLGWGMAARAGWRRARERASWRLSLERDGLTVSTENGDERVPHHEVGRIWLDDDTLQVVLERRSRDPLRLEATWGGLGAVQLHDRLLRWWSGEQPKTSDN